MRNSTSPLLLFIAAPLVVLIACATESPPLPLETAPPSTQQMDISGLDQYSDEMNPLFQQYMDLSGDLGRIITGFTTQAYSLSSSANRNSDLLAFANRFKQELRGVSTEMRDVMQEWSVLAPPEEARSYHQLAFEMMQQRYNGVELTIVGYEMLGAGQNEAFVKTANDGANFFDQSDRLYMDVLAEARKLGIVEITRSKGLASELPTVTFVATPAPISVSDIETYVDQSRILNPASEALDEWTVLSNEHSLRDLSKLDRQQKMLMIQAQHRAATNVFTATKDALTGFRLIVPPPQCQEIHLLLTESLQLQEQSSLVMKTYLEIAQRGRSDADMLHEANNLMAEADRVKQRGLFFAEQCFGK
ncbi:MAG: hypothetical protein IH962_04020 [Chloroflexi bacterium]|nr:hypothetical protein [Chloroflexota bacterium]